MLILTSLHSPRSNGAGIGVLDTELAQFRFIQLIDSFPDKTSRQIRGIAAKGERIYALTPNSLRSFVAGRSQEVPLALEFERFLSPGAKQSDFIALHASHREDVLYIGNNDCSSIDIHDLDGTLKERIPLSGVVPDMFKEVQARASDLPIIRHISESASGEILLTLSFPSKGGMGRVVRLSDGVPLTPWLESPQNGTLHEGKLWVAEVLKGVLKVFSLEGDDPCLDMELCPQVPNGAGGMAQVHLRGLLVDRETAYCATCDFHQAHPVHATPRLIEFDTRSGVQKRAHHPPSFWGLVAPRYFDLVQLPEFLHDLSPLEAECVVYNSQVRFTPKPPPAPPKPKGNPPQPAALKQDAPTAIASPDGDEESRSEFLPEESREPIIEFFDVSLCYTRSGLLLRRRRQLRQTKKFWAVRNLSFAINKGERVGMVGRNGSGKSTTSLLCVGALTPNKGKVESHGRVQLLSLGVGFQAQLTGRQNAYISGGLLGLTKAEMDSYVEDIVAFSELGEFFDEPVRTYSSGMRSRLGFAISTVTNPDLLVLDEVMSTGDASFRQKALARLNKMRERVGAVLIVSHDPSQLRKLCSRIIWLEQGIIVMDDMPQKVLEAYSNFCNSPQRWLEKHPLVTAMLPEEAAT